MIVPSKVNLFLRVLRKRPDSYHELDMVFYPLETPHDELEIEPVNGPETIIFCDTDGVPCDPAKNLCGKAVTAYFSVIGEEPKHFRITLKKSIPVAAGMGGGSSDAASVLLALQKRYGLLTDDQLRTAALSIGADVPFFLNPKPSHAAGVGELLTEIDHAASGLPIRIFAPGFPVSAKWAYTHRIENPDGANCNVEELIRGLRTSDLDRIAVNMTNDLEPAILQKFPFLNVVKRAMLDDGALRVMVSGSGPTLFGLWPEKTADPFYHWNNEEKA